MQACSGLRAARDRQPTPLPAGGPDPRPFIQGGVEQGWVLLRSPELRRPSPPLDAGQPAVLGQERQPPHASACVKDVSTDPGTVGAGKARARGQRCCPRPSLLSPLAQRTGAATAPLLPELVFKPQPTRSQGTFPPASLDVAYSASVSPGPGPRASGRSGCGAWLTRPRLRDQHQPGSREAEKEGKTGLPT